MIFQPHVSNIFGFRMSNNVRKCKFYLLKVNRIRCKLKHLSIIFMKLKCSDNLLSLVRSNEALSYSVLSNIVWFADITSPHELSFEQLFLFN